MTSEAEKAWLAEVHEAVVTAMNRIETGYDWAITRCELDIVRVELYDQDEIVQVIEFDPAIRAGEHMIIRVTGPLLVTGLGNQICKALGIEPFFDDGWPF